MASTELLPGRILVKHWQYLDAHLDNEIAVGITSVYVSEEDVQLAESIRQEGWTQIAGGGGWPPSEEEVEIRLTAPQWFRLKKIVDSWEEEVERVPTDPDIRRAISSVINQRVSSI